MLDSVLKVFAGEFDVNSFLQSHQLPFEAEAYIKGEPDLLGSPNLESGFDALLSETPNSEQHMNEIKLFLQSNESLFRDLKQLGVNCVIDIASTVSLNNQFTQAVHIPIDLLGLCYKLNISVEFSAYPDQNEQHVH